MKKLLSLLSILTVISLVGCAQESGHASNAGNNIYYSMQNDSENSSTELVSSSVENVSSSSEALLPKYEQIDVDFSTMDQARVPYIYYDMEDYPSQYTDKIVKVSGPFMPYDSVDPTSCYPAIYLFNDSTGCCAYCMEFLLYGVPVCSPEGGNGYPLLKQNATIVGRFEKYYEGSSLYIHLVDAIWLEAE